MKENAGVKRPIFSAEDHKELRDAADAIGMAILGVEKLVQLALKGNSVRVW